MGSSYYKGNGSAEFQGFAGNGHWLLRVFEWVSKVVPRSRHQKRSRPRFKRRTQVIRIFPNEESVLRLIRALAVEIHEDWIEAQRFLNMEMLREQSKRLQLLEAA